MTTIIRIAEKEEAKEIWYWLVITDYQIIKTPYILKFYHKEGCDRIWRLSARPGAKWEYVAHRCY
ncbi:hypothetical protein [Thermofilum sp.]|uniref:hypothetical protein n=1 Tax=Thermofilum sp. TaxID=1961369 RepID=UPI00316805F9